MTDVALLTPERLLYNHRKRYWKSRSARFGTVVQAHDSASRPAARTCRPQLFRQSEPHRVGDDLPSTGAAKRVSGALPNTRPPVTNDGRAAIDGSGTEPGLRPSARHSQAASDGAGGVAANLFEAMTGICAISPERVPGSGFDQYDPISGYAGFDVFADAALLGLATESVGERDLGERWSLMPARKVPAHASAMGSRVRLIRRRRGLSLEVAAGLAGMSKGYLSKLENGLAAFERRSTIESLARALSCSIIDITGEPYIPVDRDDAEGMAAIPGIEYGLHDVTLDDVPDIPARPVSDLLAAVRAANEHRDQVRYGQAGREIGDILTELQVIAATGTEEDRQEALKGLVELGIVTYELSKNLGHVTLAVEAAQRGYDAAQLLGDPVLLGFAGWYHSLGLLRVGAHRRARRSLETAAATTEPLVGQEGTLGAQVHGLVHLTQASQAARAGQSDEAHDHLTEASSIATRTGECNAWLMHFGPTNVQLWTTSIGVELVEGAAVAGRKVDPSVLGSKNRTAGMHFDLARAYSQEDGRRDTEAIAHLDQADQIAPARIRHDPIARSLLDTLDSRARSRSWELSSLRHRWGVAGAAAR